MDGVSDYKVILVARGYIFAKLNKKYAPLITCIWV